MSKKVIIVIRLVEESAEKANAMIEKEIIKELSEEIYRIHSSIPQKLYFVPEEICY